MGGLSLGCTNRDGVGSGYTDVAPPDASTVDATAEEDAGSEASAAPGDAQGDAAEDAADASDANGCSYGTVDGEPLDLRCAGLYSDWATKTVSPEVHQYDPGLHLWSDGAVKTRWIYLPPKAVDGGPARIDTTDMDEWNFPAGTKFFKEFALGGKRIETRMLWKKPDSNWFLTTYQWSPDGTTATEFTDGELDADGNGYEIPAQFLCHQCHGGRKDTVLGFEAVSLASANATPITMGTLIDAGWISDAPDASLAIPGNAVDVAALGYLHANCGTACHNPGGEAKGPGFFMRLKAANLGSVQATDTWQTGVNQMGRFMEDPMRIVPYDAGASCVHYRMSVRDGVDDAGVGLQMPKIDSHKVDDAGIATITQWINQGCK